MKNQKTKVATTKSEDALGLAHLLYDIYMASKGDDKIIKGQNHANEQQTTRFIDSSGDSCWLSFASLVPGVSTIVCKERTCLVRRLQSLCAGFRQRSS